MYVAVDRGNSEPLLAKFESESGIRVRAVYDAESAKTTGLVSRIRAESAAPRCDVFWNNEIVQTLQLERLGQLDPYDSPAAADLPARFRDDDRHWTAVALRARVIVYNTRYVKPEEAPRTLEELADEKWRGRVAIADPQFGTTRTHIAALFAAWGASKTEDWLLRLLENDVRIVDGNAMVKQLVGRADPQASPIFVGLTDTDDVLAGQADGLPIAMLFPDQDAASGSEDAEADASPHEAQDAPSDGDADERRAAKPLGTLAIPSVVSIVRGAPHPEAARRLVDFLVAAETTRALAADDSGYVDIRATDGWPKRDASSPRFMTVAHERLESQLEPSTRWTAEHFRP